MEHRDPTGCSGFAWLLLAVVAALTGNGVEAGQDRGHDEGRGVDGHDQLVADGAAEGDGETGAEGTHRQARVAQGVDEGEPAFLSGLVSHFVHKSGVGDPEE